MDNYMYDCVIERLGVYFQYHDIYNRYGMTFEDFVEKYKRGVNIFDWEDRRTCT